MANSENPPALLRVNEVLEYLPGTSRSQLQNLYPHLHVLALPRGNRRFPRLYISGLAEYLHGTHMYAHRAPVEAFVETHIAATAIAVAEADLDDAIAEKSYDGLVLATDAATILNLGRMSITQWAERAELTPVYEGPRRLLVTETSLRNICVWQRPAPYEPESIG